MKIPRDVVLVVETTRTFFVAIDFGKLFSSPFNFLSFHTARVKIGHGPAHERCPLCPQEGTFLRTAALRQKQPVAYLIIAIALISATVPLPRTAGTQQGHLAEAFLLDQETGGEGGTLSHQQS